MPERSQKPQLVEGMRNGSSREDGDLDKMIDRMVSIPKGSLRWGGRRPVDCR